MREPVSKRSAFSKEKFMIFLKRSDLISLPNLWDMLFEKIFLKEAAPAPRAVSSSINPQNVRTTDKSRPAMPVSIIWAIKVGRERSQAASLAKIISVMKKAKPYF